MRAKTLVSIIFLLTALSCDLTSPPSPADSEVLDGPIGGLTVTEQKIFLRGDVAFNDVFTIQEGLGPVFVANQCAACHPGDGKGSPFVRFTRFGQSDTLGNQYLLQGGPQLQHRAIPGFQPEILPPGASTADLIAPAVTGLGLLDAIQDATLLNLEDPDDLDDNGISGRVHWNEVPRYVTLRSNTISKSGRYISRFGKKAAVYDLLHQTSNAYNQDMGITSEFESLDPQTLLPVEPEVSAQTIHDVVFYLKTLKPPIQRNPDNPDVMAGRDLFSKATCTSCHISSLSSGDSPIEALANKTFSPYTDLLLHDMGPGLDDGYTEGFAQSSEWRTPALWGLGLSRDSQGGQYFLLHDGRATSIGEAILWHGGEAQQAKEQYEKFNEDQKALLITFLESL